MDETTPKISLIIRSSPTDEALSDYYFDAKFERVRKSVRERNRTVGEADIAYRVFNHWDKSGLLPKGMQSTNSGWRKFNFIERVWLEVIKKLRDFGLPLNKIAKVRENIMRWHKEDDTYPEFEYFVLAAKYNPSDSNVVVFANGDAGVGVAQDVESSKGLLDCGDMLLISLKGVLKEMGLSVSPIKPLHDLTNEETELLGQIRLDENDELKIKTGKDGRIKEIEATAVDNKPPQHYEVHKSAKEQRMYGRVVTQYVDGKPVSVHVTKRKRLDK